MTEGIIIGLAIAGGWAAFGILALRYGGLKSELSAMQLDRDRYRDAAHLLKNEIQTQGLAASKKLARRNQEIEALYDALATCGTDDARGRLAIDGIRGLLSTEEPGTD